MKRPTEAKMTKRKTWRWVTRDSDCSDVSIWLGKRWRVKPELKDFDNGIFDTWMEWRSPAEYFMVCAKQLKSVTGLTVPTDRPVRVEFSARVLDDEEVTP